MVYFGDLHTHNAISYAHGSIERGFEIAQEHLDFFCLTGQAQWPDMPTMPGVTGAWDELPKDLKDSIARIRQVTDLPIAVGFGISTPEQVGAVCDIAGGAIVGSAAAASQSVYARPGDSYSPLTAVFPS